MRGHHQGRILAAAAAASVALAACAASGSGSAPAKAELAGRCTTGLHDLSTRVFDRLLGKWSGIHPRDQVAEAYKLTLTNPSQATAKITSFTVSFSPGASGGSGSSDTVTFAQPVLISPGQSRTWLEQPWGSSSETQQSGGPYGIGTGGPGFDVSVTCQFASWTTPHKASVQPEIPIPASG